MNECNLFPFLLSSQGNISDTVKACMSVDDFFNVIQTTKCKCFSCIIYVNRLFLFFVLYTKRVTYITFKVQVHKKINNVFTYILSISQINLICHDTNSTWKVEKEWAKKSNNTNSNRRKLTQ